MTVKETIINVLKKIFPIDKVKAFVKRGLESLKTWSIAQITKLFEWLENRTEKWFEEHEHSWEEIE